MGKDELAGFHPARTRSPAHYHQPWDEKEYALIRALASIGFSPVTKGLWRKGSAVFTRKEALKELQERYASATERDGRKETPCSTEQP
jgi:hypothetical protein